MSDAERPNVLVIWGDDIGITNLSCYSDGLMGYRTPNIDRIAREGMLFTDAYGEQSCTAGRSSFITGQSVYRTGLSKVGIPASPVGMPENIVTMAALLKNQGYATGQFGKNHLGDLNRHLPTAHGFDEFFGNLYHLNAEEEPEMDNYPSDKDFPNYRKKFGPRGVIHSWATDKDDSTEHERWGRVGNRKSKTPGRSTVSGWRPSMTNSPPRRQTSSSAKIRMASRSSSGSTRPTCTGSPTPRRKVSGRLAVGSRRTTTR
jgi:arylsulfatase